MPRPTLDKLYADGRIDAEEYVNLMLAGGAEEKDAIAAVHAAHDNAAPDGWVHPKHMEIEPELPQYSRPTRTPRRRPSKPPTLRGHPLD